MHTNLLVFELGDKLEKACQRSSILATCGLANQMPNANPTAFDGSLIENWKVMCKTDMLFDASSLCHAAAHNHPTVHEQHTISIPTTLCGM
jgi:hypothetical protein